MGLRDMQVTNLPLCHCEERSDEAIKFFLVALDCFASLAMTVESDQYP
jgi:hypothetical protein